jgi:hypothetical protein
MAKKIASKIKNRKPKNNSLQICRTPFSYMN